MKFILFTVLMVGFACSFPTVGMAQEKEFVGSDSCKECHEGEYKRFMTYAKKAGSFGNIKKMETKLTPDEFKSCFECHTTGYEQKGGFISEQETPGMKNPGCEVCHGPGSLHVESGYPENIQGKVQLETCNRCHSSDRIEVFDFKPLLFGGAH
jgi:hypothetical protein